MHGQLHIATVGEIMQAVWKKVNYTGMRSLHENNKLDFITL